MCRPFPLSGYHHALQAAAILGAPIACWALYGCLMMAEVNADIAGALAVIWGVPWLALAHFGHAPRWVTRTRRSGRRYGSRTGRAHWNGAVLASLFIPVPIYFVTVIFEWTNLMPISAALPMVAILASAAPAAFWWIALTPPPPHEEGVVLPIARVRNVPDARRSVIPPRTTAVRRAV